MALHEQQTIKRGSRLDRLFNKKKAHPWAEDANGDDDAINNSDDDLNDFARAQQQGGDGQQQLPIKSPIRKTRRSLGPAPQASPRTPKSSGGGSKKKKKKSALEPDSPGTSSSKKSSSKKASKKKKKGKSSALPAALPFDDDDDDDNSNDNDGADETTSQNSNSTSGTNSSTGKISPKPRPQSTRAAPVQAPATNNNNNNKKSNINNDSATSDMELLNINFEKDGDGLREAIGEEVLAMWDAQGLYLDLPELRPAILKGVVEQKFLALVQEQAALQAWADANPNATLASLLERDSGSNGGSVGSGNNGGAGGKAMCDMSIIAEGSDEEDESSCDEEYGGNDKEEDVMSTLLEEDSVMDDLSHPSSLGNSASHLGNSASHLQVPVPPQTTNTADENYNEEQNLIALNASKVLLQELEVRLQDVNTDDHDCIEAIVPTQKDDVDVPIRDQHAFTKFRLHDAVEKRVSEVFTGDHKVLESTSKDEEDDEINDSEGESEVDVNNAAANNNDSHQKAETDYAMDASSSSLPALSPHNHNSKSQSTAHKAEMRQRLSQSFSNFDAQRGAKATAMAAANQLQLADDEWTECTADFTRRPRRISGGKGASVPRTASRGGDTYYEEFTVAESEDLSVMEEYTVKSARSGVSIDVDALSEQRSMDKRRLEDQASAATGNDDTTATANKNNTQPGQAVITPTAATHHQPKSASLDNLGGSCFPTITTTGPSFVDDDDMTCITFDQTMDGMNSVTQDHHHASSYFNKSSPRKNNESNRTKYGTKSPPRKQQSEFDSQQTDPTRASTSAHNLDDSSGHDASSADMSSQAATALAKSVAKLLRVDIWSPKATVVLAALEKLAQAASIGSFQRANIARLGGIIGILRAMQMHGPNAPIQLSACQALHRLSVDRETQIAIGDVGGIPALAASMEGHMEVIELQVLACKVLNIISYPRSEEEDQEADEDDVPTDGAVPALVASMMRYSTNTEVQAHAFGALANLCLDHRGNLQQLSETGGLTAMTLALQRPWKNKMDQHEAISTLSILLRSLAELPAPGTMTVDC